VLTSYMQQFADCGKLKERGQCRFMGAV